MSVFRLPASFRFRNRTKCNAARDFAAFRSVSTVVFSAAVIAVAAQPIHSLLCYYCWMSSFAAPMPPSQPGTSAIIHKLVAYCVFLLCIAFCGQFSAVVVSTSQQKITGYRLCAHVLQTLIYLFLLFSFIENQEGKAIIKQ